MNFYFNFLINLGKQLGSSELKMIHFMVYALFSINSNLNHEIHFSDNMDMLIFVQSIPLT
jgi:hypothetical protein